jgi:hypothetical protein
MAYMVEHKVLNLNSSVTKQTKQKRNDMYLILGYALEHKAVYSKKPSFFLGWLQWGY